MNLSGLIPSRCVCWKSCIAFPGCPSFTYHKLLIPTKNAQLHCAWWHCRDLCYHPLWVSSVHNPKCFLCLLMFEIWVPFICLQPQKIQIKLINIIFCTALLHLPENFVTAYCISGLLLLPPPPTTIPPVQRL